MPKQLIYPLYTGILALITFVLVPRKVIRRLAIYGIVFGAVVDVLAILIVSKLLGVAEYINFGTFGAFGIPLFPPIAWTAYFIMYLYLLPERKPWRYIFPVLSAGYSLFFANVLQAAGILKWHYNSPFIQALIYFPWHFTITWAYFRMTGEVKENTTVGENTKVRKFTIAPEPAKKKEQPKQVVRYIKLKRAPRQ